jgi:hypothetical protein
MGHKMNAYRVLVEDPEEKTAIERHTHRLEDNIKMDVRETGWGGTD